MPSLPWATRRLGSFPRCLLWPPARRSRLELLAGAAGGLADIADVQLHVLHDDQLLATLAFDALLLIFTVSPIPGGLKLTYPGLTLESGPWEFILSVRDQAGHLVVTAREYTLFH